MRSFFPKGRLSRMLAAGLLVFLLPAVVFAIPPEEPGDPSPLVLDNGDPAAAYRDVSALLARRGLTWTGETGPEDGQAYREEQYDKLAAALRASLDLEAVYRILERGLD